MSGIVLSTGDVMGNFVAGSTGLPLINTVVS